MLNFQHILRIAEATNLLATLQHTIIIFKARSSMETTVVSDDNPIAEAFSQAFVSPCFEPLQLTYAQDRKIVQNGPADEPYMKEHVYYCLRSLQE